MDAAVYASPEPLTLMAPERHLRKYWRLIALTTVQTVIGSMHERLKPSIRNKGDANICALS